jgi:16S rRNA processing protein RimM
MSDGERLVVAQVRGFHGLRGMMRLEPLTDREAERFAVGRTLFVEGQDSPLTVVEAEPAARGWRVRFAEVPDRISAEKLRDAYLEAVVGPGEELPRGEYYWHQVVGSKVADLDGTELGEVVDIYRAGGAEVLMVSGPAGDLDVPVVRPVVRIFAPARGEIVIDGEALGLRGDMAAEAGEVEAAPGEESGRVGERRPGGGPPDEETR